MPGSFQISVPQTIFRQVIPPNTRSLYLDLINQLKILRQLLAASLIDQTAVRKDRVDGASSTGAQYATSRGVPYKALGITEDVFIHPSSVLANVTPPEYIVFNEVVRSTQVWLKGRENIFYQYTALIPSL